ncbi:MAG TPA: hypothetical protein VE127_02075 [Solirubrobacteraceae bacterium]|jgi:hypothetical protein|nr:hypothetical protein [Solirubrobacteraceae bacterium]
MTVYYSDITALIDPEQFDLVAGGRLQDVSVILTDRYPDRPPERPAAITLSPADARELAFCLLELAEEADQMSTRR